MKKIKDYIKNKIEPFFKRHENLIGVIFCIILIPIVLVFLYSSFTTALSVVLPVDFDAFNPDHIILFSAMSFSILALYYVFDYAFFFAKCIVKLFKTKKDTDR